MRAQSELPPAAAVEAADAVPPAGPAAVRPMARWRVVCALILLAIVVFGHIGNIFARREWYPFLSYPMYHAPKLTTHVRTVVLYGVNFDGTEFKIPNRQLPVTAKQMRVQLKRKAARYQATGKSMVIGPELRDFLLWHDKARRKKGNTDWPKLAGVRVYEQIWYHDLDKPDEDAVDLATPDVHTHVFTYYRLSARPTTGPTTGPSTRASTRPTTRPAKPAVRPPAKTPAKAPAKPAAKGRK
jgi:hypothetical protein